MDAIAARGWVDADAVVERFQLAGAAWVDVVRGLVPGGQEVHDDLEASVAWRPARVFRYERWIDEPRLFGGQAAAEQHPALEEVGRWLTRRYRVRFDGPGLARYRHERDSVGWHRDRDLRWLEDTLVAVLSLGARRSFQLRPLGRRRDLDDEVRDAIELAPAAGDLIVMGGRCQAAWLHAVPKQLGRVGDRISAQWRWTSRRGRPDTAPSFYAPRFFDR